MVPIYFYNIMKHTLDLHGYTHSDAIKKTEDILLLNQVYKHKTVEIITGNSTMLQNKIIREILDAYEFDYYIPSNNAGMIVVTETEF
jgi:hypothetical protein